jgi:hypothetical protein
MTRLLPFKSLLLKPFQAQPLTTFKLLQPLKSLKPGLKLLLKRAKRNPKRTQKISLRTDSLCRPNLSL